MGISNPLYMTADSAVLTGGIRPEINTFLQSIHERSAYLMNALVDPLKTFLGHGLSLPVLRPPRYFLQAVAIYTATERFLFDERNLTSSDAITTGSASFTALLWPPPKIFIIMMTRLSLGVIFEPTNTATIALKRAPKEGKAMWDRIRATFDNAINHYIDFEDAVFSPFEAVVHVKTGPCARGAFLFGPILVFILTVLGVWCHFHAGGIDDSQHLARPNLQYMEQHNSLIFWLSSLSTFAMFIAWVSSLLELKERTKEPRLATLTYSLFDLTSAAIWHYPRLAAVSISLMILLFGPFVGMAITVLVLLLYLFVLHVKAGRAICCFETRKMMAAQNKMSHNTDNSRGKQRTPVQLDFFKRIEISPESTAADHIWKFVQFADDKVANVERRLENAKRDGMKDKERLRVLEWLREQINRTMFLIEDKNTELQQRLENLQRDHAQSEMSRNFLIRELGNRGTLLAECEETVEKQKGELGKLGDAVESQKRVIDKFGLKSHENMSNKELEEVAADRGQETKDMRMTIEQLKTQYHYMERSYWVVTKAYNHVVATWDHLESYQASKISTLKAELSVANEERDKIRDQCTQKVSEHREHVSQLVDLLVEREKERVEAERLYDNQREELSRALSSTTDYAEQLQASERRIRELELNLAQLETKKNWCDSKHGDSGAPQYVCLGLNECKLENYFYKRNTADMPTPTQTHARDVVMEDGQDCVCTADTDCRRENCLYSAPQYVISNFEESDSYDSDATWVDDHICPGVPECNNSDCSCGSLVEHIENVGHICEVGESAQSGSNESEMDDEVEFISSEGPEVGPEHRWCGFCVDSEVSSPSGYFNALKEDEEGEVQDGAWTGGRGPLCRYGGIARHDSAVAEPNPPQVNAGWTLVDSDVGDENDGSSDSESEPELLLPVSTIQQANAEYGASLEGDLEVLSDDSDSEDI